MLRQIWIIDYCYCTSVIIIIVLPTRYQANLWAKRFRDEITSRISPLFKVIIVSITTLSGCATLPFQGSAVGNLQELINAELRHELVVKRAERRLTLK